MLALLIIIVLYVKLLCIWLSVQISLHWLPHYLWKRSFWQENGEGGAWCKDDHREEMTSQWCWMRDQSQKERYFKLAGTSLIIFFYKAPPPPISTHSKLIMMHCPVSSKITSNWICAFTTKHVWAMFQSSTCNYTLKKTPIDSYS